jgi:hypothetical protein
LFSSPVPAPDSPTGELVEIMTELFGKD